MGDVRPSPHFKDFAPVAHLLEAEGLLVVHPSLPVETIPELVAYARANPGKLSYASAGVIQQARAGRLRAVAVIGATRSSALPEVPAIAETLPGFEVSNWIGLFAPAGTPPEIVAKLNAEVQKAMRAPDVEKRLETEGAKFIPTTPESFAAFQRAESEKWGKAIRDAGIKVE